MKTQIKHIFLFIALLSTSFASAQSIKTDSATPKSELPLYLDKEFSIDLEVQEPKYSSLLLISNSQSSFEQALDKQLIESKKKCRFSLNFVPTFQTDINNRRLNNLDLVRHGHDPYYHNPIQQPNFTESIIYSVAYEFLKRL